MGVGGIDVLIRFCLISSTPFPLTQNAQNQPGLWSLLTNGLNILKQKAPCRSVSNVCNHSRYRLTCSPPPPPTHIYLRLREIRVMSHFRLIMRLLRQSKYYAHDARRCSHILSLSLSLSHTHTHTPDTTVLADSTSSECRPKE